MECIGAIDQGTQSSRFYIFNAQAEAIASAQVSLPQHYRQAGWCEHDPMEILASVQTCIAEALKAAEEKVGPVRILALGITNQRETTIVWDKLTGKPLHNAIVWHDNRTSEICARLKEELGGQDYFRPVTGLPISTYFSAFKYLWFYENLPAVREAVEEDRCLIGTVESWLIYHLTGGPAGGVHVTDVTNASRTNLMDLRTCQWHQPYLDLFKVRHSSLPRIVSNAEVYGHVREGPLAGVPIAGCLGDQQAAMLGQRCEPGEAKNTYGTGCFMLLNTGANITQSTHGLLTTLSFQLGPDAQVQYALEGSVAVAGLGISWLKDNLGLIDSPQESEELARTVPDTGGVYFVPAFSGLLAPHWQDHARGTIVGLTGFTGRAHVVRAMLEAICFQTREVLGAMRQDAVMELRALRVDGGATSNNLLMQLQADILQVPVDRPTFQETTSLGAALAAGLAVGFWSQAQVFQYPASKQLRFTPAVSGGNADRRFAKWRKAVSRCLDLADLVEDDDEQSRAASPEGPVGEV